MECIKVVTCYALVQWFSTRVPWNPWVPLVQSRGSVTSYTKFYFKKINCCFFIRQMNYCTGVPGVTGRFSWGSAPAKRLKTTALVTCDKLNSDFGTA